MSEPKKQDFEAFAAIHGASRSDLGDAGVHSAFGNMSKAQRTRILNQQNAQALEWYENRQALRERYQDALKRGFIVPPTHKERLLETASGHPDNRATKAAIKLLKIRYGITV